jgi:hypothetical protein
MAANNLGDTYVNGTLQAKTLIVPAGAIVDSNVAAGANIDALKLRHVTVVTHRQKDGTAVVTQTELVGIIAGATGTILTFQACLTAACTGAGTVTVDLQKNGVSVLSAAISFSNADAANAVKAGTINTAAVVQGDLLRVVVTATAGGGAVGQGLVAVGRINELPR